MPGALLRCFCDGFGETARCSAEKRRPIAGELDQPYDARTDRVIPIVTLEPAA